MIREAQTENGIVRGLPSSDARVTVYKGIPYAAPPVDENRWRAPQRCEDWEGILNAYTYGPIAIQDTPGLGTNIYCREWHVDSDIPMDEDCLYLNIWTPAKSSDEGLSVLIWFHGGAYQWGYTAEMEFEGDRLARRGIIVVTVGYRLAALGFMAHPELTKESPLAPANFGLLDQQAAIKWVSRNIKAFGGDPSKITIAGQSAGGSSVMTQMTCEDNYSDIKGAAILSGVIRPQYWVDVFFNPWTLSEAEKLGEEFFKVLGVDSISEARKLDAIYIRDKYAEYVMDHMRMSVCIDGNICKGNPMTLMANNKCADIPLFVGNTSSEFVYSINASDVTELEEKAKDIFGDMTPEFMSFPESTTKNAEGYGAVGALEANIKALIELKEDKGSKADSYYYRFDCDIPGEDNPGTFHSVDLWFYFETLAKSFRPFVGRHYDLSRNMCNYFANFVKYGNPNGRDADGSMMPEWKPYKKHDTNEMVFTSEGPKPQMDTDKRTEFFIKYAKSEFKID